MIHIILNVSFKQLFTHKSKKFLNIVKKFPKMIDIKNKCDYTVSSNKRYKAYYQRKGGATMNTLELKAAIKRSGMSMNEFLTRADIKPSTWSRRMTGKSEMTLDEMRRIIKVLNLSENAIRTIFFS